MQQPIATLPAANSPAPSAEVSANLKAPVFCINRDCLLRSVNSHSSSMPLLNRYQAAPRLAKILKKFYQNICREKGGKGMRLRKERGRKVIAISNIFPVLKCNEMFTYHPLKFMF
jgi:hypothetical protein